MHLFSFKSHTKQRLKGFFLIFIVLVTYLCIAAVSGYLPFKKQPAEDRSFSAFTSALFREEAASNTLNLHFTLQDPTQYGITDTPITFGSFSSNVDASKVAIENCQASLETFSYNALSEKNKLTYDILTSYLQTAETGTSYLLHEEPLSPITGMQAQLPVLLAEYRFEKASDIETYLTLLETTPDYFASLIDFEKEKAFVLGFSEILRKTVSQISINIECCVVYEVIVQLYKYRQLVRVHGITGELIHSVLKRNATALWHPYGDISAVLGKNAACSAIGFYDRSHATEQAFLRNCFLEFFVATGGQCIPTGNAVCSTMDLIVCVLNTSHGIPEVCAVFGSPDEIFLFVEYSHFGVPL